MSEKSFVIWFTGLSGAGKSALADKLYDRFRTLGRECERLDGDAVRNFFPGTGFSRKERNDHIKKMGFVASLLEKHGVIVIASFISPYRESRDFVRNNCQNFIEIYLSTPLEVCEKRDVKGLYRKARNNELNFFTGISDPYETPLNPEIMIDTTSESVEASLEKIWNRLISLNIIDKK